MNRAFLLATLLVIFSCAQSLAQNWRGTNPDQPNGYRASEYEGHYHGNVHLPAQQQNGYRASEARSHYGGSRFEPSSGWNTSNTETETSDNRSQSRNWYANSWGIENRPGILDTASYAGAFGSRLLGRLRAAEGSNTTSPAQYRSILQQPGQTQDSAMHRLLRSSSGGFNKIYVGE
jgi:hypothetical protein